MQTQPGATNATPTIANLVQSNRVWREGKAMAVFSRKHKPPVGTTFSFGLDEQAAVRFAFTQRLPGRMVKGKCVAAASGAGRGRTCRRTVTQGTLTFAGHRGANRVSFQGRLTAEKKLKPGPYTLVVTATASGGQPSKAKDLSFTIVG